MTGLIKFSPAFVSYWKSKSEWVFTIVTWSGWAAKVWICSSDTSCSEGSQQAAGANRFIPAGGGQARLTYGGQAKNP